MNTGLFVLFEGIDRSGKTTQTRLLVERLRAERPDVPVVVERYPDRSTRIGALIDAYLTSAIELDDRAVHLLFAANRWECARRVERALAAGAVVVCDRYAVSGAAFTAAKGIASLEWCRAADIVFWLCLDAEDATKRGQYGDERYERVAFQRRVGQFYHELLNDHSTTHAVDASRSIDEIAGCIWDAVNQRLGVRESANE